MQAAEWVKSTIMSGRVSSRICARSVDSGTSPDGVGKHAAPVGAADGTHEFHVVFAADGGDGLDAHLAGCAVDHNSNRCHFSLRME